jgi:hypothetical protein
MVVNMTKHIDNIKVLSQDPNQVIHLCGSEMVQGGATASSRPSSLYWPLDRDGRAVPGTSDASIEF